MGRKVVIVGAGQVSATLVAKLRADGYDGGITVLGDENTLPYQRPPLSKAYLLGKQTMAQLHLRPAAFYNQAQIDLRLGCRAMAIEAGVRVVRLHGNEVVPYDHLVLATGSAARSWPAALGGTLEGVRTLRTFSDADSLSLAMRSARSILVIGGGYVGLELASAARTLGLAVTVVEAQKRILNRVAGEDTARYFRTLHVAHGTRIVEGMGVRRLLGDGRVEGAELENGEVITCDLVIVGIGAIPATALAVAAGLEVDDGVVTDEFCRTSDPFIWAAGDCARVRTSAGSIRLESVGNAIDQAETVAANILGGERAYRPRPWFWTEQHGVRMQIAGLSAGHDETVLRRTSDGSRSSCWYFRKDNLIAVDAINDAQAFLAGRRLIDSDMHVDRAAIGDPAFDLRSLAKAALPEISS